MFGLAVLSGLAGCANTGGEYTLVTKISTGERMQFVLSHGRPEWAKSGSITVRMAGLNPVPGKTKQIAYGFCFEDSTKDVPKAVRIDDVSDPTEILILEDMQPQMKDGVWVGSTRSLDASAPEIYWLTYLDDTTRVFRIRITRSDGSEVVLYQAWIMPSFLKSIVRGALGMNH